MKLFVKCVLIIFLGILSGNLYLGVNDYIKTGVFSFNEEDFWSALENGIKFGGIMFIIQITLYNKK